MDDVAYPNLTQTETEVPKKSSFWKILGIIFVIVVLIGGIVIGWVFLKDDKIPEECHTFSSDIPTTLTNTKECITILAVEQQNIKLCDHSIFNNNPYEEAVCFGRVTQDLEFCKEKYQKLFDKGKTDPVMTCSSEAIIESGNYQDCEKLQYNVNGGEVDLIKACISKIALKTNDIDLCKKVAELYELQKDKIIEGMDWADTQEQREELFKKEVNTCFSYLETYHNNNDACFAMPYHNKFKESCLITAAEATKNPKLCDQITINSREKERCMSVTSS